MDEMIDIFVETFYSDEMKSLVYRGLGIFESFQHYEPFPELINLAMSHQSIENSELSNSFVDKVKSGLCDILSAHGLVVSSDSRLSHIVELCTGLGIIQRLENYESLARKLEGTKSDIEIVCEIFEQITALKFIELMDLIEELNPSFMEGLKTFIGLKDQENDANKEETAVFKMDSVKAFEKKFGGDSLGVKLLRTNTPPGYEFKTYANLTRDFIVKEGNIRETALNFYSLMLISNDGHLSPITFFRQIAGEFFSDMSETNEIEKQLLLISAEHESYRRAYSGREEQNDKN